jgi:GT2 family glycosyltransferase
MVDAVDTMIANQSTNVSSSIFQSNCEDSRVAVRPSISAVILSYNSAGHIKECVDSLMMHGCFTLDKDEIIIFENGSIDASINMIQELENSYGKIIRLIKSDINIGTTASRNAAIRISSKEFLLILDADVVLLPSTIDRLCHTLSKEPRCGLVVPRLIFPNGKAQLSVDTFPTLLRKIKRWYSLRAIEQEIDLRATDGQNIREVDYAISACWLMPRRTIDAVGLFDERIFYSPEDVDFCIRVWENGLRVILDEKACAIHDANELSRRNFFSKFMGHHLIGLAFLFWKHKYILSSRGLYDRLGRCQ